jgi:hypothetical protein
MGEVSTIGLDIAKSVFQIHGVDAAGAVVVRKRITRAKLLEFFAALPACLVGIEACPTAHYWSRRLQPLGHTVRSPRLFRNPNCFTGGGAPVALVSGSACILGCLVSERWNQRSRGRDAPRPFADLSLSIASCPRSACQ